MGVSRTHKKETDHDSTTVITQTHTIGHDLGARSTTFSVHDAAAAILKEVETPMTRAKVTHPLAKRQGPRRTDAPTGTRAARGITDGADQPRAWVCSLPWACTSKVLHSNRSLSAMNRPG